MNVKELSSNIRKDLADKIAKLEHKPCLAVIQVGNRYESSVYVRNKERACTEVGIQSTMVNLPDNITELELIQIIHELNNSKGIHGILVQLPLPKHINPTRVSQAISPVKDVDCFHSYNCGCILNETGFIQPCTPSGVLAILKYNNVKLKGSHVVIVGRSNIVGKPLALMLINEGATVTVCNSSTKNLKSITSLADVVVTAIGKPKYFTPEYFKPDATIIDVGINRGEDGKLCGDVDYENVKEKVANITPVPGGVGIMTVTQLLVNTFNCYKNQI